MKNNRCDYFFNPFILVKLHKKILITQCGYLKS